MAPLGEDVIANISDYIPDELAPLLTLFGEQATKQFLSVCLGWSDVFILSLGPIGIITVIVSTIRVGDVKWLKALIGRARESKSIVEQELLSSTSRNVCELWSGQGITRTIGSTVFKDLLIDHRGRLMNLLTAYTNYGNADIQPLLAWGKSYSLTSITEFIKEVEMGPANLTVNLKGLATKQWETSFFLFLGFLLQSCDLVYAALTTYYWPWGTRAHYAYVCFTAGTILVFAGLLACGRIIESVTIEYEIYRNPSDKCRSHIKEVIRVQEAAQVGDQFFDSYAIRTRVEGNLILRASRLTDNKYKGSVVAAVSMTAVGFIAQFIGSRGLDPSCGLVHLGVTLVMTGIRALVHRGLTSKLNCERLLAGTAAYYLMRRSLQIQGTGLTREPDPCFSRVSEASYRDVFDPDSGLMNQNDLTIGLISAQLRFGNLPPGVMTTNSCISPLSCVELGHMRCLDQHINVDKPLRLILDEVDKLPTELGLAMDNLLHFKEMIMQAGISPHNVESWPLCRAIEATAALFCRTQDLACNMQIFSKAQDPGALAGNFNWTFDVRTGALNTEKTRLQVTLSLEIVKGFWKLSQNSEDVIHALVECSAGTLRYDMLHNAPSALAFYDNIGSKFPCYYILGYGRTNCGRMTGWMGPSAGYQAPTDYHGTSKVAVFGMFMSNLIELETHFEPVEEPAAPMSKGMADNNENSWGSDAGSWSGHPRDMNHFAYFHLNTAYGHVMRELFSIFFLALVSQVREIPKCLRRLFRMSVDEVRSQGIDDFWRRSPFLGEMFAILQEYGLGNDRQSAMSLVIPAFLKFGFISGKVESGIYAEADDNNEDRSIGDHCSRGPGAGDSGSIKSGTSHSVDDEAQ